MKQRAYHLEIKTEGFPPNEGKISPRGGTRRPSAVGGDGDERQHIN